MGGWGALFKEHSEDDGGTAVSKQLKSIRISWRVGAARDA